MVPDRRADQRAVSRTSSWGDVLVEMGDHEPVAQLVGGHLAQPRMQADGTAVGRSGFRDAARPAIDAGVDPVEQLADGSVRSR